MKKLTRLRVAMFEEGLTSRSVARAIGLSETLFSMALKGRYILDDEQKAAIAEIVKRPVNDLFQG